MLPRLLSSILASLCLVLSPAVRAAPSCEIVRFADVGWTDITVTTAVATALVEGMGLKTRTLNLAVPVTFASLKNKDVDVFLGNWMPTMAADIKPFAADGSVETLRPILTGARYTLAVPRYVADAGVKSFADLAKHKDKLGGKIYGIEPGNDGNRLIQRMIDTDAFGLKGFKLVESSEQAMLMQVTRATKSKDWVVFLAWAPHPMNQKLELTYLTGGDDFFGPNLGGSTVYINVRKGYTTECPVVAKLLDNLEFTLDEENALMSLVLDDKLEAPKAARQWLKAHPERLAQLLAGVKTAKGEDALPSVRKALGLDAAH
jgi:glycine betaine/proline transport system substrate-binding protein